MKGQNESDGGQCRHTPIKGKGLLSWCYVCMCLLAP